MLLIRVTMSVIEIDKNALIDILRNDFEWKVNFVEEEIFKSTKHAALTSK